VIKPNIQTRPDQINFRRWPVFFCPSFAGHPWFRKTRGPVRSGSSTPKRAGVSGAALLGHPLLGELEGGERQPRSARPEQSEIITGGTQQPKTGGCPGGSFPCLRGAPSARVTGMYWSGAAGGHWRPAPGRRGRQFFSL